MTDTLVVSVAQAKQHLRVTSNMEDSYIESLILAVQAHAASFQGRTYLRKTLDQVFDEFPINMDLSGPPLVDITSIHYLDDGGADQLLDPSYYRKDATTEPGRVTLEYMQTWPETRGVTNSVTVTYTAGYADAAAFTAALPSAGSAILLGVCHLYEHRSSVSAENFRTMPLSFYDLLWPDRITEIIPDGDGY